MPFHGFYIQRTGYIIKDNQLRKPHQHSYTFLLLQLVATKLQYTLDYYNRTTTKLKRHRASLDLSAGQFDPSGSDNSIDT